MHPIFLPSEFTSRDRWWINFINQIDPSIGRQWRKEGGIYDSLGWNWNLRRARRVRKYFTNDNWSGASGAFVIDCLTAKNSDRVSSISFGPRHVSQFFPTILYIFLYVYIYSMIILEGIVKESNRYNGTTVISSITFWIQRSNKFPFKP